MRAKKIRSQKSKSTLFSKQCVHIPVVACADAIVVLIVVHRFACGYSMSLLLWICSYTGPLGRVSEVKEFFSEFRRKLFGQSNPYCVLSDEADLILEFLVLKKEVVLGFLVMYMIGCQFTGVKVLRILIQKPFFFKNLEVNFKASHVIIIIGLKVTKVDLDVNGDRATIFSLSNKTRVGFRVRVEFWGDDEIVVWFPITYFVNTEFQFL